MSDALERRFSGLNGDDPLRKAFLMCALKCSCRSVSMHESDYDCNNGRFATKGDCVDDGNGECFTTMVMIITTVVLVFPSISHRRSPSGSWFYCCAVCAG